MRLAAVSSRSSFSSLCVNFRATSKRNASQSATSPSPISRTVLVREIPSDVTTSQILDKIQVGPLEHIEHDALNKCARFAFLDSKTATNFKRQFDQWDGRTGMTTGYSTEGPLGVEKIAALGLRHASRAIRVNPVPEGATEGSLRQELSRFGAIEKIDLETGSDGKQVVHVHFHSIDSALRAVQTLRTEEGWGGKLGISFLTDRCDLPLRIASRKLLNAKDSGELQSTVAVLHGVRKETTRARILAHVKDALPPHNGEAVLRVDIKTMRGKPRAAAFLNFANAPITSLFLDALKAKPLDGVTAYMKSQNIPLVKPTIHRAVKLGATRTILIKGLDKNSASKQRIFDDFRTFGTIISVKIQETAENSANAFVSFADLMDALKAVDRIYQNNRNFRRYAGTKISFAAEVNQGQVAPSMLPLHIATLEDSAPKESS
ncbi:hypothetical protein VNI00_006517 [Paramarasmius palmivorus]|uniref:RRM domain-containing protein n=1 Tax=Paramarasmius palmivorus TaxID=297713 RepID=A0AAW0D4D3_9AGAR